MLNVEFFERARGQETFTVPSLERETSWQTVELGELTVPSGRLVACDPLGDFEAEPFTLDVDPGEYPVCLYLARFGTDERVGYAAVWFRDSGVVAWEPALLRGEDPTSLRSGEFFGYGVDSGTGAFLTPEVLVLLKSRMERERDYYERIIELMEETYADTRSWARIQPEPSSALAFFAFSTGFGDGFYASYVGRGSAGQPVCLVTDFDIAYVPESEPEGKPKTTSWWQFWRR